MTFGDIDEELYTLAAAIGSSFELEGLEESRRDTLRAGLEANAFEFRLANHSAILFKGNALFEASGNLLRRTLPGGIGPYEGKAETPYTAVEPYSGQNRVCRFLVTHLAGKAQGSTLVLFRPIEQSVHALARLDRALAAIVAIGFLGTAGILAFAVGRAIRPVEVSHAARARARGERPLAARARHLGWRGVPAARRGHQLAARPSGERLPRPASPDRRRGARAEDADRRPARRGAGGGTPGRDRARAAPVARDDRARRAGPRARGGRPAPPRPRRRRAPVPEGDGGSHPDRRRGRGGGRAPRRRAGRALPHAPRARRRWSPETGRGSLRVASNLVANAHPVRPAGERGRGRGRPARGTSRPRGARPGARRARGGPPPHLRALREARPGALPPPGRLGTRPRHRRPGRAGPRRRGRGRARARGAGRSSGSVSRRRKPRNRSPSPRGLVSFPLRLPGAYGLPGVGFGGEEGVAEAVHSASGACTRTAVAMLLWSRDTQRTVTRAPGSSVPPLTRVAPVVVTRRSPCPCRPERSGSCPPHPPRSRSRRACGRGSARPSAPARGGRGRRTRAESPGESSWSGPFRREPARRRVNRA